MWLHQYKQFQSPVTSINFSEKENDSSLFSNFIESKKKEQDDDLDDNIKMVIID